MPTGNFFTHYWRSFAWIALAIFTAIAALVVFGSGGRRGIDPNLAVLLVPGFLAACYRAFRGGYRVERHADGCVTTILATLFSLTVGAVLWPAFELLRQIRFLIRARSGWGRGEILVNEKNGRPLRSA